MTICKKCGTNDPIEAYEDGCTCCCRPKPVTTESELRERWQVYKKEFNIQNDDHLNAVLSGKRCWTSIDYEDCGCVHCDPWNYF